MKKATIIFNPTAGLLTKNDVRPEVEKKLSAIGIAADFLILDKSFEAVASAYDWSATDFLIALGGDGTVKVAARTILEYSLKKPLAIIPFGSANVLASALKIPPSIDEAIKVLGRGNASPIDVGRINGNKYFLVGFSLGYISSIVIGTDKELKNRFGFFGYAIRLFWNKVRMSRIKFKIETKNKTFWVRGNSLIVFNAFNFYGFQAKKNISLNDGILNLYVTTNRTFLSLIQAGLGLLLYSSPSKYLFCLDNSDFRVSVRHRRHLKTCQIDGDYIKLDKEINIDVLPGGIKVFN